MRSVATYEPLIDYNKEEDLQAANLLPDGVIQASSSSLAYLPRASSSPLALLISQAEYMASGKFE